MGAVTTCSQILSPAWLDAFSGNSFTYLQFHQGPVWCPAYTCNYSVWVGQVVCRHFELLIFLLFEQPGWIILLFKEVYSIALFDKGPLFDSIFCNTFLTTSANRALLDHFWRLILESLNLFIFLANILQGDVPGLCGPSPGAKLKLPFLIFMTCSQSVHLNFTPYCIHLKLAFIVIDFSAEKIPGLTPEWNIKITNPHLLPRIWVFDQPDLGAVHQFANKYKVFTMFILACTLSSDAISF